jgi:hypothetical protein
LGRLKKGGFVHSPVPGEDGVPRVGVCDKVIKLGRVVLYSFGTLPPSIRHSSFTHIDGNPSNNRVENLRWALRPGPPQKISRAVRAKRIRYGVEDPAWTIFASEADAARILGFVGNHVRAYCQSGGGVLARRAAPGHDDPDYKYLFEYADKAIPISLAGEEWRRFGEGSVSDKGRYCNADSLPVSPVPAADGFCHATVGGADHLLQDIVAAAFLPAKPAATTLRHKNGLVSDNSASNLEFAPLGALHIDSDTGRSFVSFEPTRKGKRVRCQAVGGTDWVSFESVNDAARHMGISSTTVRRACGESA